MAPKKKVVQPTKPVRKRKVTTSVTPPPVVEEVKHTGRGTWASIMEDKADPVMKKPRSWAEWADRQLDKNHIK